MASGKSMQRRKVNGADRVRTGDIQIGNLTLYQLSYRRAWRSRQDSNLQPVVLIATEN